MTSTPTIHTRSTPRPEIEPSHGVYRPAADSRLLIDAFAEHGPEPVATVLDLCCGSGVIGISAAMAGHRVEATDSNRRAVVSCRRNALLNGVAVGVRHGSLFEPVRGQRFDAILSNPPYVPTPPNKSMTSHDWSDGGADGRRLIDQICSAAPDYLSDRGSLWLVHSSICGADLTHEYLISAGLTTEIIAESFEPFGPLTRERLDLLRASGAIGENDAYEQLVVFKATLD